MGNKRSTLVEEMVNADFGDVRLSQRLARIVAVIEGAPQASFPTVFDDAELEGAYRFWSNERVDSDAILEPHLASTGERAATEKRVRVLHDTTALNYGESEREGLGRLREKAQGMFLHASLVVSADEARRPLGLVAAKHWTRGPERVERKQRRGGRPDGEGLRWQEQAKLARSRLEGVDVVHVMDREADSYELFCALEGEGHFVVRATSDRVVQLPSRSETQSKMQKAARHASWATTREVFLSSRKAGPTPQARRIHPPRLGRLAKLAMSSMPLRLRRPDKVAADRPGWLDINVVYVTEVDGPPDEPAVIWTLLTDLSIATAADVEAIVDHYRARWLIEEFFKAIKTGCSVEKRQLESYHALANMLATLLPVAASLLALRSVARSTPDAPASQVVSATQIDVLRAAGKRKLPPQPTARDALLAVAALGGHIKNNGEPGWQVLWRGMQKLLVMEIGWTARTEAGRLPAK